MGKPKAFTREGNFLRNTCHQERGDPEKPRTSGKGTCWKNPGHQGKGHSGNPGRQERR